ncbi:hypothetical protein Dolphis_62 [Pseudomonas phage Dolphis]|nr:hypothetical protein Dolphis_62 [Pseudomonas phage Dolphis]
MRAANQAQIESGASARLTLVVIQPLADAVLHQVADLGTDKSGVATKAFRNALPATAGMSQLIG